MNGLIVEALSILFVVTLCNKLNEGLLHFPVLLIVLANIQMQNQFGDMSGIILSLGV